MAQTKEKGLGNALTLGIVSETYRQRIEEDFGEFARYAADKLSNPSDISGAVMVAPTAFQLVKLLEQRRVDFFLESPYATHIVNHVHGAARVILRRWKRGKAEYQSLLFTKKNGGVKRLEDLQGKIIGFEDADSTSGYFLPKLFLQRKGFRLANKSRFDPHGSPAVIGYIFARSQAQLVDWVLSNKVAAGAFSDDDHALLEEEKRTQITVLAQTEQLPRHLLSVRRDLSAEVAERLANVLLRMHRDGRGQKILKKADDTTKFDLLPGGEADLRRVLGALFSSTEKR